MITHRIDRNLPFYDSKTRQLMYQQSPADLIYPFQSKEHDVDGDDPGYVERRLKYKDHPEVIPWMMTTCEQIRRKELLEHPRCVLLNPGYAHCTRCEGDIKLCETTRYGRKMWQDHILRCDEWERKEGREKITTMIRRNNETRKERLREFPYLDRETLAINFAKRPRKRKPDGSSGSSTKSGTSAKSGPSTKSSSSASKQSAVRLRLDGGIGCTPENPLVIEDDEDEEMPDVEPRVGDTTHTYPLPSIQLNDCQQAALLNKMPDVEPRVEDTNSYPLPSIRLNDCERAALLKKGRPPSEDVPDQRTDSLCSDKPVPRSSARLVKAKWTDEEMEGEYDHQDLDVDMDEVDELADDDDDFVWTPSSRLSQPGGGDVEMHATLVAPSCAITALRAPLIDSSVHQNATRQSLQAESASTSSRGFKQWMLPNQPARPVKGVGMQYQPKC